MTLSPEALAALKACIVTRGPNKGRLLSQAPSPFTRPIEYAAWQGAMLSCNAFKASIAGMMFMKPEQRAICAEVTAFFDATPQLRGMDRDRAALERLGVW